MSSERVSTSAPSSSDDVPGLEDTEGLQPVKSSQYVPHIFDLVVPSHRARDLTKAFIPNAYLQSEAVDASLLLGHGASFTASRQALPPAPEFLIDFVDMGDWTIEKRSPAPKRPKYIVYKSARVSFQENGEPATPKDRRALQSVLTEYHALLNPSLIQHPNIIDFLGLAWGSSPFEPLHKLPVLVVEYADRGTLADLQSQNKSLPDKIRLDLCLGTARGLSALHENGIVHGDVKPENILVFSHPTETFVAKLADFGFAIIEETENPEISIGGTRIWRAPESRYPIPKEFLKKTDVYSLGLLIWSVAVDGQTPFDMIIRDDLLGDERLEEIDRMKEFDEVIQLSNFNSWLLRWNILKLRGLPTVRGVSSQTIEDLADLKRRQETLRSTSAEDAEVAAVLTSQITRATSMMCQLFRQKVFYGNLEAVLLSTLSKDPTKRHLDSVIGIFSGLNEVQSGVEILSLTETTQEPADTNGPNTIQHIPNVSNSTPFSTNDPVLTRKLQSSPNKYSWLELGYKRRWISWQRMRDLDRPIQTFVTKSFLSSEDGPGLFALAAFHVNGYGVEHDDVKAVSFLSRAARAGHELSQAYLYRMYKSCNIAIPGDEPITEYLIEQASRGSRMAAQDLKTVDPAIWEYNRKLAQYFYAGVGATWYDDSEMLHGFTREILRDKVSSLDSLGTKEEIRDLKVNRRGDHLIHFASASGLERLVEKLLEEKIVDINQLNDAGETALLCACRSGHGDIVKLLLDHGAKAMPSKTGETPLHWLVSFNDNIDIAALGTDLIERGGADIEAATATNISYSTFPSGIDVDHQGPGTPLMWAVHNNCPRIVRFLLSKDAEPRWNNSGNSLSCLEWASFYHHTLCLQLMISHLEEKYQTFTPGHGAPDKRYVLLYGPLIRQALHAADKFSMILRHGAIYLERLHSMLKYFQTKTEYINFQLGSTGETILYLAASKGHDDSATLILKNKWNITEINKPSGLGKRTPLLESVRWNRRSLFKILMENGADIKALARNPFDEKRDDWTALHVFANEAHDEDLAMVGDLLDGGLSVDGPDLDRETETPFNIAVRKNAFKLANFLLSRGADMNSLSARSSFMVAPFPMTGLGHIIALNARYSAPRLRYLLSKNAIDMIVEPARELTALHLAALLPAGFKTADGEELKSADFDAETNRAIVCELLVGLTADGRYIEEEGVIGKNIDRKCGIGGKTALHLAAEKGKVGVVVELIRAGADKGVKCEKGETAWEAARRVFSARGERGDRVLRELGGWLE